MTRLRASNIRRAARRWLARLADTRSLGPLLWSIRARRRARKRAADTREKSALYDRLARIATPPEVRGLENDLRELAASDQPITFARWHGSIELELLYWIPFLTWAGESFGLDPTRCTAIVRPGTEPWYTNVAAHTAAIAADGSELLPSSFLECLCTEYWREAGPLVTVLERLRFKRIDLAASSRATGTAIWPGEPPAPALQQAASATPDVVDLGSTSLDSFTTAVANAELLIGAAHGLVHLGPMLGVPTIAIGGERPSPHLDLAQRAARAYGTPFDLVHPQSLPVVAGLIRSARRPSSITSG